MRARTDKSVVPDLLVRGVMGGSLDAAAGVTSHGDLVTLTRSLRSPGMLQLTFADERDVPYMHAEIASGPELLQELDGEVYRLMPVEGLGKVAGTRGGEGKGACRMANMYREGDAIVMKVVVAEAHDVHDLLEERYEGADLAKIEAHMDRLLAAAYGAFGEVDEDEIWAVANDLIMGEAEKIEAEIRAERVLKDLLEDRDFYDPVGGMYVSSHLADAEPGVQICHISADDLADEADAMTRAGIEYKDGRVAPFEVANLRGSRWKSIGMHSSALEKLARRIADEGWVKVGADLDDLLERTQALLEKESKAYDASRRRGGPIR